MGQDLRKLFKEERKNQSFTMKEGHQDRFAALLNKEMPQKKKRRPAYGWRIAATVALVIGLGAYFFLKQPKEKPLPTVVVAKQDMAKEAAGISLGDLSPDLEKIEHYYVANINYELSKLNVSDDNKEMVDGYLQHLETLDAEYELLNKELNELGPNDQTIAALINNLQLRLQLLQQLKQKLNQLKSSKNEQQTHSI